MIYWIKMYFSDPKAHFQALFQVIIVSFFSILPILIAYVVKTASLQNGTFPPFGPILGRGQMYLLGYAVFGTVIWLAFLEGEKPRHDARTVLGVIALILMMPVIGFIGKDPTFSTVLNPTIIEIGYYFYAILLLIYYLLLFYINVKPPEPTETFEKEGSDMRTRYEGLRSHE